MIERNGSRAVASTDNDAHKAEFQSWTVGGALTADVGAGLIVYGIYKRSPMWGALAGLGWLALTVKMTSDRPDRTLSAMDRWGAHDASSLPSVTGWEPWSQSPVTYRSFPMAPSRGWSSLAAQQGLDTDLSHNVQNAQHYLNAIGIGPHLVEDGILGRHTIDAIVQFQRSRSLPATGRLDGETSSVLSLAVFQKWNSMGRDDFGPGF